MSQNAIEVKDVTKIYRFWGVTIVMMLVGLKVFKKLRPHFSDVL